MRQKPRKYLFLETLCTKKVPFFRDTLYCYCTNKDKHKTKDKYLYDVGPMEYVNLDIVTAKQINA